MREIKFRAWDEDGFMFIVHRIDFRENGHHVVWSDRNIFGTLGSAVIALMQYTGLKDKNGKEIYEGDIIRVYGDARVVEHKKAFWTEQPAMGGFGTPSDAGHKPLYRYSDIEVIGNIYENPDLLKSAPADDE